MLDWSWDLLFFALIWSYLKFVPSKESTTVVFPLAPECVTTTFQIEEPFSALSEASDEPLNAWLHTSPFGLKWSLLQKYTVSSYLFCRWKDKGVGRRRGSQHPVWMLKSFPSLALWRESPSRMNVHWCQRRFVSDGGHCALWLTPKYPTSSNLPLRVYECLGMCRDVDLLIVASAMYRDKVPTVLHKSVR